MQRSLNDLTKAVTAFSSWDQFAQALESGYVPTLTADHTSRSKATREWNELVHELVRRLKEMGYRVHQPGQGS